MSGAPIPIALVGAGFAYQRLYREPLARTPGVAIGGVVDTDPARLAGFANGTAFASIDDMLRAGRPAGALVLTPPATHADIAARFAAEGIPVLVEKPPAFETRELTALDPRYRAHYSVAFSRRYWPTYRSLKANAAPQQPLALVLTTDPGPWGAAVGEGGAIRDLLPHLADIACWVRGRTPDAVRTEAVEEGAEVCLEWTGAAPIVCLVRHAPYAEWAHTGSGKVRLGGSTPLAGAVRVALRRPDRTARGVAAMLHDWTRSLAGDRVPGLPGFDEAFASVAVVEAALASLAAQGEPVTPASA